MTGDEPNGTDVRRLSWEVAALKDTLKRLEGLKLDVLVDRVSDLTEDMRSVRRMIVQVGVGIVSSAIVFAFTVFALLGNH